MLYESDMVDLEGIMLLLLQALCPPIPSKHFTDWYSEFSAVPFSIHPYTYEGDYFDQKTYFTAL